MSILNTACLTAVSYTHLQLENSDGKTEANSVLIRTGVVEDTELRATMNDLQSKLGNYQIQRVEQVGATIGSEPVSYTHLDVYKRQI